MSDNPTTQALETPVTSDFFSDKQPDIQNSFILNPKNRARVEGRSRHFANNLRGYFLTVIVLGIIVFLFLEISGISSSKGETALKLTLGLWGLVVLVAAIGIGEYLRYSKLVSHGKLITGVVAASKTSVSKQNSIVGTSVFLNLFPQSQTMYSAVQKRFPSDAMCQAWVRRWLPSTLMILISR